MEAALPYPLQWPQGRSRRAAGLRRRGKFNTKERRSGESWLRTSDLTVDRALGRLQAELDRIGARYAVVSTNIEVRRDGLPRSGQREPDDPGVAVFFQLSGKPHCMPCDTYDRVADNIAAIAAHMEATRAIERHGVATVAEMFAGFAALPSPSYERPWREVLELRSVAGVSAAVAEAAYRRLARERHPDQGGSDAMMAELNRARDEFRKELRP